MINLIIHIWPNIKTLKPINRWGWSLTNFHKSIPGSIWIIIHTILFCKLFLFFFFDRNIYILITYIYAYSIAWTTYSHIFDIWYLNFIKGFIFYLEKLIYKTKIYKYIHYKVLFCINSIIFFKTNKLEFIEVVILSITIIYTKILSYIFKFVINIFFTKRLVRLITKSFLIILIIINPQIIIIYVYILSIKIILKYIFQNLQFLQFNSKLKFKNKQKQIKHIKINFINDISIFIFKNVNIKLQLNIYVVKKFIKIYNFKTPKISQNFIDKLIKKHKLISYMLHKYEIEIKNNTLLYTNYIYINPDLLNINTYINTYINNALVIVKPHIDFIKKQLYNYIVTFDYTYYFLKKKPKRYISLNSIIYIYKIFENIILLIPTFFINIIINIYVHTVIYTIKEIINILPNIIKFVKEKLQLYFIIYIKLLKLQLILYKPIIPIIIYNITLLILTNYIIILQKLPSFKLKCSIKFNIYNFNLYLLNFYKFRLYFWKNYFTKFYKTIIYHIIDLSIKINIYIYTKYYMSCTCIRKYIYIYLNKIIIYTWYIIIYKYIYILLYNNKNFLNLSSLLFNKYISLYITKKIIYDIWFNYIFTFFSKLKIIFTFIRNTHKIEIIWKIYIKLHNRLISLLTQDIKYLNYKNLDIKYTKIKKNIYFFFRRFIEKKLFKKIEHYLHFFKKIHYSNNYIWHRYIYINYNIKYIYNIYIYIIIFFKNISIFFLNLLNPLNNYQYLYNIIEYIYRSNLEFIILLYNTNTSNFLKKINKIKFKISIPIIYLIDDVEYSIVKHKSYMYFSNLKVYYQPLNRFDHKLFIHFEKISIIYRYYINCIEHYIIFFKNYINYLNIYINFIHLHINLFLQIINIKITNWFKIKTVFNTKNYFIKILKELQKFILILILGPINILNNIILIFSYKYGKIFYLNLKIKKIFYRVYKFRYNFYNNKKKVKIEIILFFVMSKYYFDRYLTPLIYYLIRYPIVWIHRHTIYPMFLITYFYTADFILEVVVLVFTEEYHDYLAYLVRHKYLWPLSILLINLDLLYIFIPIISTISLLIWSQRNQWYFGKWLWTFFVFPICFEFHRPLLTKLLLMACLEDYNIITILLFKLPFITEFIKLNNFYHIFIIILLLWFIKISINGLTYRHIWRKPNLPRWHFLRFPIYITIVELFRFKIIYYIHIINLYFYEKLDVETRVNNFSLYLETNEEFYYYYEFFFYTFLRVSVEDTINFYLDIKYLNSFFLGYIIDLWIALIVIRCLLLYSREFLGKDKDNKYGMFPQGMYVLCFRKFFYIILILWVYWQCLEIELHLVIIFWIMKYSIFVFLYFQVTLYMFPRKVTPWYFSIISEFWPTLYNDIHKSMSVMIPTQDAMMVFQKIYEDMIEDWERELKVYIPEDKLYTFFYLWQFQVRKRKKLYLFGAYHRLMTRMQFMLREHTDLFYLGWRFDFYRNWRKRYIYVWKINFWRRVKLNLIYRALILRRLYFENNDIQLYKFSIRYIFNLWNYRISSFFERLYLFNYSIFKQHNKTKFNKSFWLKTNLFAYKKRYNMLYAWKKNFYYKAERYIELSILQDLKIKILANNLEPANEFGERPEIFWPPKYWDRYKKEGWKLFRDPEIDNFIYSPFSDYRYMPKYLYDMEKQDKELELYLLKKVDITIK